MLAQLLGLALDPVWVAGLPPGEPRAIALAGPRVLVGTEQGLYGSGPTGYEPLLTRGAVRDLSARAGAWLVATDVGLYEWREPEGRVLARSVAAGADVRAVALAADATAWVATEVGLFMRPPGAEGFERVAEIPASATHAVRLAGEEVWVGERGTLWVRRGAGPFTAVQRGAPEGWWEIVDAVRTEHSTLLAVPEGLWRVEGHEAERIEIGLKGLRALCARGEQVWIASAQGVFAWTPPALGQSPTLAPLVASVEAVDFASGPDRVWVVSRQGILALGGSSSVRGGLLDGSAFRSDTTPQSVRTVQRAALLYLGLSPARFADLDRRARWSGAWPELRAGFLGDRDRGRTLDHDESVSGGSVFQLLDAGRDSGSEYRLELELSWDLERLASPSDAIAISRERREVVELAERILDRVNQTFFERERAVSRLEGLPADAEAERSDLALRVRELTAALDGWTGGAFSRLAADSPTAPGSSP